MWLKKVEKGEGGFDGEHNPPPNSLLVSARTLRCAAWTGEVCRAVPANVRIRCLSSEVQANFVSPASSVPSKTDLGRAFLKHLICEIVLQQGLTSLVNLPRASAGQRRSLTLRSEIRA